VWPCACLSFIAWPPRSPTVGVRHAEDEEALALVRRADFRRAEKSDLNRETKSA
jgi:hypothetical protein